ncbi:MAG: hypothetical protein WC575_01305 [Patescibacteria group bacterium]
MFRETLTTSEKNPELVTEQLSNFDEKIIDRLGDFENNITEKFEKSQYHAVMEGLCTSMLHQLEWEFSILLDDQDQQRSHDLKESHNVASYLVQLGELLYKQGISVSWYDQKHYQLATSREKTLTRIIAEHEALEEIWPYINKQSKINEQSYNHEQLVTIKNIVEKFDKLPPALKQEKIKLVTDDNLLKQQIEIINRRFNNQNVK